MPYKNPEDRKRRTRERRKANLPETAEQMRNWRKANPAKVKAIRKKNWATHSADYLEKRKQEYWENPELFREKVRRARVDRYSEYLVRRLMKKSTELGLPFDLEPSDIVIPETCPALGIRITVDGRGQRDDCPSVDRIVPEAGYVKGNIRIVSMKANRIKNNATVEELERVLLYMRFEHARHSTSDEMGRV